MSQLADRSRHMDRVLVCAKMLCEGAYKGEIKKHMRDTYQLKTSQINKYISRARKHLHEQANADRDELRGASIEFYRAIVRDESAETRDRLAAQARIDKILGLEAPTQSTQIVSGKMETKVVVSYEGDDWGRQAVSAEQLLEVVATVAAQVNVN